MKKPFLLLAYAMLVLSSCHDSSVHRSLNQAETLLLSRPDSSLFILEGIDKNLLNTSELGARFSLLYSMALDKNYIDTLDISIIEPSLNHYSGTGSRKDYMLSLYYAGRIHYNRKEYANAISHYSRALELTNDDDFYHIGMIYGAIGDSYNASFNNEEELSNLQKSYEAFQKSGNTNHINLAGLKLAQAYHNNSNKAAGDSLLNTLFSDDVFGTFAISAFVENDLKSDNPSYVEDIDLLQILRTKRGCLYPGEWYQYAYAKYLANDFLTANRIVQELSQIQEEPSTLCWRYKIAVLLKQPEKALVLLQQMLTMQNETVKQQLSQSVFKSQAYEYKAAFELEEERTKNLFLLNIVILTASLLFVSITLIFIWGLRNRIKKEKDYYARALEESQNMLNLARENERTSEAKKMQTLRKQYAELFQKQYSLICHCYSGNAVFDSSNLTIKAMKQYTEQIEVVLKEITGRSFTQKEFENRINGELGGILEKIRADFPQFSDEDIRFICYLIVGFDTSSISFLMDISKENVRVKKHRIKERIVKSNAEYANLFCALA